MSAPDKQRINRAKAALDDAVRAYTEECNAAWSNDNGGMVIGWTIGIAVSRFDENSEEEDNLIIESAPGMNNWFARGVADATAESFQAQASGWGDDID